MTGAGVLAAIRLVCEDQLSEQVALRLAQRYLPNHVTVLPKVCGGQGRLIAALDQSRRNPPGLLHLFLTDLDTRPCAVTFLSELKAPLQGRNLIVRIAVREVESWVLADREGLSDLFGVALARFPASPDEVIDPKELILQLARKSQNRDIRDGIVPRNPKLQKIGPEYNLVLGEFVRENWNISAARKNSPSLNRTAKVFEQLGLGFGAS